jgi:hypothetical protein
VLESLKQLPNASSTTKVGEPPAKLLVKLQFIKGLHSDDRFLFMRNSKEAGGLLSASGEIVRETGLDTPPSAPRTREW